MSSVTFPRYAIAQLPTPVFNTPHIADCFGGKDGNSLSLDSHGLMRGIETILFPQTKLELLERVAQSSIWRIRTDEYPYEGQYFVDECFIQIPKVVPPSRTVAIPSKDAVLSELEKLVGARYIWGGNWPQGIHALSQLYPSRTPLNELDPLIKDTWTFKGLDCSGLIHYVTKGWTPRNTSKLVCFGNPVPIEGLSAEEILDKVKELDLIVWSGHVICVLNRDSSIESKHPEGVIKFNLLERISQIMRERKPVNDWKNTEGPRFVIRRWI